VWDAESGDVLHTLSGHERSVRALAFSTDGTLLVSGATNGDIFLWDVVSGEQIRVFNGHNRTIQALDFSPDGDTFASVSVDSTLRVWDVESGFEVRVYTLDERQVTFTSVAFSGNGDTVLSGLSDGRLRLWRLYPSVDALLAWTLGNRHVPSLTCAQREQFRLEPFCAPNQPVIVRELPELPPVPTLPQTLVTLAIGDSARVNVTGADNLRLRTSPNLDNSTIVTLMPDGSIVTLIDGPITHAGFTWWRVRMADGVEGWAVESLLDEESGSLQTLVPLSAFEGL
jgi:WD40 repeat protein